MATDSLGSARLDLIVDTSDYEIALSRAKNSASSFGDAAEKAFDAAAGTVKRASKSLLDYVAMLGKTADQQRLLRAAQAGVDPAIIQAASSAMEKYAASVQEAAAAAKELANDQKMAAGYDTAVEAAAQAQRRAEATEALTLALHRQDAAEQALMQRDSIAAEENAARIAYRRAEATEALTLALMREDAAEAALRNRDFVEEEERAARATYRRAEATSAFLPLLERLEQEERAAANAKAQGDSFITYLQNLEKTANKTHYEILELRAAELGLSEQAGPLIARLREQTAQFGAGALSAKQYQAALRGVPAQITDIVVSLQAGQAPLTVLLQQGGQLKDMFGGVGAAARALGGELLKLATNPYLLTTAAVAALAAAMYRADDITDEFNLAIIRSGNYAQVSAQQLQALASAVAGSAGTSYSKAAAAITAVVNSGRIGTENLVAVSKAAAEAQEVLGTKVEDTISTYNKLADKPLDALLDLNKAENFLTAAQIERIAQLEDEGDKQTAVNEAITIYLGHQETMIQQVRDAYSPAKEFWTDLKTWVDDVTTSLGQAGLTAADTLTELTQGLFGGTSRSGKSVFDLSGLGGGSNTSQGRAQAAAQAAVAEGIARSQADGARAQADAAKNAQKNVEFDRETLKLKQQTLTTDQKIAEMTKRAIAQGISAENIAKRVQALRDEDAKRAKKPKSTSAVDNAQLAADLQTLKDALSKEEQAIDVSRNRVERLYAAKQLTTEEYYKQLKDLSTQAVDAEVASLQKQIQVLQESNATGKDAINVQKQIGQLQVEIAKVQAKGASDQEALADAEAQALKKREDAYKSYVSALQAGTVALERQMAAMTLSVTTGGREAEIAAKLADLYYQQADALKALQEQRDRGDFGDEAGGYERRVNELNKEFDERKRVIIDGYAVLAEAEADWRNGMVSGIQDYLQEIGNIAGQTKDLFTTAFKGINDALLDLVFEGKAQIDDLIKQLARMFTQIQLNKALLGAMGGDGDSGSLGSLFSSSYMAYAKGGVSDSPSLKQYSGQVLNKPTFFAFAKGAAVAGEAGPEAIMPLTRTSNGKLGVQAMGGAAAGGNVTVNNYGTDAPSRVETSRDQNGNIQIDQFFGQVENYLAGRTASGRGSLYKATKARLQVKDRN